MRIIQSIIAMQKIARVLKTKGKTIGFIPTMGALHEGHLSLIRQARQENDVVVVSIFVNPIQFGPREDFKKYPRNLKQDARLCGNERVDIVFSPDAKKMYPDNYKTYVVVEGLSDVLCGKFRDGHFKGVSTIVTKLFNIINPDIAYFGQKDAQQTIIIQRMACDLNMPIKIKVMPTIRQKNNLAMSSRNVYLSPDEKKDSYVLFKALNLARNLVKQGNRNPQDIIRKMQQFINKKKNVKVQYISIVALKDLKPVKRIEGGVLIALAVWIGKTRLIDNIIVRAPNG